jgi:hypothetical protein
MARSFAPIGPFCRSGTSETRPGDPRNLAREHAIGQRDDAPKKWDRVQAPLQKRDAETRGKCPVRDAPSAWPSAG